VGGVQSFEAVIEAHRAAIERLLPDDQALDTQQPALREWYETLDDEDIVWCIGEAAGAYGLLAAERLGSDRVLVFESDVGRLSTVRDELIVNGYEGVTIEPVSFLGWQRYGVTGSGVVDDHSDDPIGEVTKSTNASGRPTTLLLDVPGYGGGLLSALSVGTQQCVEKALLKTTDTLAESQLTDAGFETTVVAERPDTFAPWRRAVLARRDPTTARSLSEGGPETSRSAPVSSAEQSDNHAGQTSLRTKVRDKEKWRLRDIGYLAVAVVLSVVGWLFLALATVLEVIERGPFRRIVGRILVGLLIAGLFVLFLVLATVLAELGQLFGASEKTGAGVAGIIVLAIPIFRALFFLKLALGGHGE